MNRTFGCLCRTYLLDVQSEVLAPCVVKHVIEIVHQSRIWLRTFVSFVNTLRLATLLPDTWHEWNVRWYHHYGAAKELIHPYNWYQSLVASIDSVTFWTCRLAFAAVVKHIVLFKYTSSTRVRGWQRCTFSPCFNLRNLYHLLKKWCVGINWICKGCLGSPNFPCSVSNDTGGG